MKRGKDRSETLHGGLGRDWIWGAKRGSDTIGTEAFTAWKSWNGTLSVARLNPHAGCYEAMEWIGYAGRI